MHSMGTDKRYEEKLSIVALMMQMAMKDGVKSAPELRFISSACEMYNLNVKDISPSLMQKEDFKFSDNLLQRIADFQKVLLVMFVDRDLSEEEVEFCMNVALKMGISPVVVQTIIDGINSNDGVPTEPKKLMEMHKLHDN